MKYDLTQCNNLRWKDNRNGVEGFTKVFKNKIVLLEDETEVNALGEFIHLTHSATTLELFKDMYPEGTFTFMPRNPETYKDWQVGDEYYSLFSSDPRKLPFGRILSRKDDVIVTEVYADEIGEGPHIYTCSQLFDLKFRLVLTDYEKELLEGKPKFKQGDKVLVRDGSDEIWYPAVFSNYTKDGEYYVAYYYEPQPTASIWSQCIPLNEETFPLLGTVKDYDL